MEATNLNCPVELSEFQDNLTQGLTNNNPSRIRQLLGAAPAGAINFITPGYYGELPLEISPEILRTGAVPAAADNDYTAKPFFCAALARWGRAHQPGDILDTLLSAPGLDLTQEDADGQNSASYAVVFASPPLLNKIITQDPTCLTSRANNLTNLAVGYARPEALRLLLGHGVSATQRSTITNSDALNLVLCRHNLLIGELCEHYATPEYIRPAVRRSTALQNLHEEYQQLYHGGARLGPAHSTYLTAAQILGYGFLSSSERTRA